MVAGAPRTTSLPPEEMIALGKEMVHWVELNNPLHLSEWYTIHKGFVYNQWKKFIEKEEFRPYYEKSLRLVGKQYLDKNSNVRDNSAPRWQRVYFPDIKEVEDQDHQDKLDRELEQKKKLAEYESSIRKDSEQDQSITIKIVDARNTDPVQIPMSSVSE